MFADLQPVALGVLDSEVLDGEIIAIHQQAFGTSLLAAKGQHALVHAGATQGDAVRAQAQAAVEGMATGRDFDHVARFGVQQTLLERLGETGVTCCRCSLRFRPRPAASHDRQRHCHPQNRSTHLALPLTPTAQAPTSPDACVCEKSVLSVRPITREGRSGILWGAKRTRYCGASQILADMAPRIGPRAKARGGGIAGLW
jgi:hypothetical protein